MFIKNETALLSACLAGIAPRLAGTSCPSRSLLSPGSLRDLLRPLANSLHVWVDVGVRVVETQLSAQTLLASKDAGRHLSCAKAQRSCVAGAKSPPD